MKHLCRRRRKPPARAGAVAGGRWVVQSIVVLLLLLRVFNCLIFKWAKMEKRERGLREVLRPLRDLGLLLAHGCCWVLRQ